jgi:hypothetical protein
MLPIEFDPINGVSIRKVSLPGDMDILKEVIFADHSSSSESDSPDEDINQFYEPLLHDPEVSVYLLAHKMKTLFVAELLSPRRNTYEYPRKKNDYILEIRLHKDLTEEKQLSKALRTIVESFFAVYPIARIVVPVSSYRSDDLLPAVLKKAQFTLLQDPTGEEPTTLYAREQASYTN